MKRFTHWVAIGLVVLASVAGFASSGHALPPATEPGTGTIGMSHFHEDGTRRVTIKSTDNWLIVEAPQDLVAFHGGPLGYSDAVALAIGEIASWGHATGTRKRDLRESHDSFAVSVFVPRQPWPMNACGYGGNLTGPNLEFEIEGSTKSISSEPVSGTIQSTKNSDVQFTGTFIARNLGFGFGTLLDYTVTVECS